jgi:two-component system sensor histidine kinase PilS (NtrC family)
MQPPPKPPALGPSEEAISPQLNWQPLGYYNFFRLVASAVFCALANAETLLKPLGSHDPQLFTTTANGYLAVGIAAFWLLRQRKPAFLTQATGLLFVDTVAIILLMHSSGGTGSGLGILLVVVIAASGLLLPRQLTLLITALATLALLGEQARWWVLGDVQPADFTRAGLLGIGLFATASISIELARRARVSATLAAERGDELRRLALLNEEIIQRIQTGVIVTSADGTIEQANRAARQLTGDKLKAGQSLSTAAPKVAAQYRGWQNTHNQPALEQGDKTRTTLGSLDDGQTDPNQSSTLIFIDNATAAAQQAQLMKMASLGTLTASIAHEIRNPLAAITTAGELIKESAQDAPETIALTDIISRHGSRVNRIIEDILQMGRLQTFQPKSIDIDPWLEQFIDDYLLTHDLPQAAILIKVADNLTMEFDPDQFHQVIGNLCDNALQHCNTDAEMPWVIITAKSGEADQSTRISITDNGSGVPADKIASLFTPFFTTRTDGTGLGLYIARELCSNNQTALTYASEGAPGATFQIMLHQPQYNLAL